MDETGSSLLEDEEVTPGPTAAQIRRNENLKIFKKMRVARDEVINKEDEEEKRSITTLVTMLRTLANERENDRTYEEKRFKAIEAALSRLEEHAYNHPPYPFPENADSLLQTAQSHTHHHHHPH